MAGGMIRVERVALFRPILEDLDQFAARQPRVETKLDGQRNALACGAGSEFGCEIIQDEPASHVDLYDLAGAMEFPGKGTARDGVAVQKTFMPHQIAWVSWSAAAGKVAGRRAGDDARLQKLARDHAGLLRLPESHRDVNAFGHQITQRIADE